MDSDILERYVILLSLMKDIIVTAIYFVINIFLKTNSYENFREQVV
jgi:hypothetical protein